MTIKIEISNAIVLFTTGLLGGTFFYTKFNILPTFWDVPTDIHFYFRIALMKHNGITVQSLMAIAIISSIWFAWTIRLLKKASIFAGCSVILTIATFLITRFGNVPINAQIKTWLPTAAPGNWMTILKTWDFYHTCRTVTAIGSFIMILIATFLKNNYFSSDFIKVKKEK